jgi:hypothetical protein
MGIGAAVGREKIGDVCHDGFVCRHMCSTTCHRRVAQAASQGSRRPIVSITKETRFNGMVKVDWKQIHYRGFTIQPKLDMGSSPWLSQANNVRTGWVIVRDGCNAMPGATWAGSPMEAKAMIDLFIEAEEDAEKFWKLVHEFSPQNISQ